MDATDRLIYCEDPFYPLPRVTREVMVGNVGIGANNPVRVQSMITADTRDTDACVTEVLALADVGCEIVRITAQTKVYAANLEHIARKLRRAGCSVPLVADIHFKPDAAMEAAKWVEKIRVNPGNYADKKKFEIREYSEAEYEAELVRIREDFIPLVQLCKDFGRAMRIGTNHGSLSDRIMNRFGDTPLGMVESALEFANIAREMNYHQLVFSMKASNPKVMIEAYRLLVARLTAKGPDWNYPIHLGVTEAGDGEDGRIKSAIGIGSLLADGIGDTIRVSLTEDSIYEIPVAKSLVHLTALPQQHSKPVGVLLQGGVPSLGYDPFSYQRRASQTINVADVMLGAGQTVRVAAPQSAWKSLDGSLAALGEFQPEICVETSGLRELDPCDAESISALNRESQPKWVAVSDGNRLGAIAAQRLLASVIDPRHALLLKDTLDPSNESMNSDDARLRSAAVLGSLLCDGIGDAVLVRCEPAPAAALRLSYNILQAAGTRIFKTDYVACPSCGRTLFNLQETTRRIRDATGHLKGVRIAVMGCIVNGPGEMADADFGYVGGAPGKINLYVGKTPVDFNIPENEAVARLINLIRQHGRWVEPQSPSEPSVSSTPESS